MSILPCVEIEPEAEANAAVIWMHGLGANGHDFEAIVPELRLTEDAVIRFVFPHAPTMPVTINGGMVMPAWYDILDTNVESDIDIAGITKSAEAINALIDREVARGIDSRRIVIAGFSQGGAVGYQVALSCEKPLAGLLALSTYFATAESIKLAPENKTLPIYIFHGEFDPVVTEQAAQRSYDVLQTMGYQVEYKKYPMEHTVNMEEIQDISTCLNKLLA